LQVRHTTTVHNTKMSWIKDAKPTTTWNKEDKIYDMDYLLFENGNIMEFENGNLYYLRINYNNWTKIAKP
jgi:hypothetical protein